MSQPINRDEVLDVLIACCQAFATLADSVSLLCSSLAMYSERVDREFQVLLERSADLKRLLGDEDPR